MNSLVCVDSMVCIWGIKEQCTEGQEAMIPTARDLISRLQRERKSILLPAPVITELLTPVTKQEDMEALQVAFNTLFRVGVVDAVVATIAASIWRAEREHWQTMYEEGGDSLRNRFKFDTLILAVAKANRVECLYTGDKKLCKLADKHGVNFHNILTQGLPQQGVQTLLGLPSR